LSDQYPAPVNFLRAIVHGSRRLAKALYQELGQRRVSPKPWNGVGKEYRALKGHPPRHCRTRVIRSEHRKIAGADLEMGHRNPIEEIQDGGSLPIAIELHQAPRPWRGVPDCLLLLGCPKDPIRPKGRLTVRSPCPDRRNLGRERRERSSCSCLIAETGSDEGSANARLHYFGPTLDSVWSTPGYKLGPAYGIEA